jgi:cell division protein FtsB
VSSQQHPDSHPTRYTLRVPGTGRLWRWAVFGLGPLLALTMLLWGEKSILRIWALHQETQRTQQQLETLKIKNQKLHSQIEMLKHDPRAVERIAREELGLVRSDEIVYRFVSPDPGGFKSPNSSGDKDEP